MIGPLRPQPYSRPVVKPQSPTWLLLLGNLQPFAVPDTFYPILAHSPARFPQRHRDASIAVATIYTSLQRRGWRACRRATVDRGMKTPLILR